MSTTPLDLPILISQLPNLQQIIGPPHEAQQVLFGQLVAENQRKEVQTVQVVEKDDSLHAMDSETGGNKNTSQHLPRKNRQAQQASSGQGTVTQSSNASPWSGNIINVKI